MISWFKPTLWTWIGIVGTLLAISLGNGIWGIGGALLWLGSIAFISALYALVTGRKSWALIPTKKAASAVLGISVVLVIVGASTATVGKLPHVVETPSTSGSTYLPTPTPTPTPTSAVVTPAPAAPAPPPAAPAPAVPAVPTGATALCNDGTYWTGASHKGACSHHGGAATYYR